MSVTSPTCLNFILILAFFRFAVANVTAAESAETKPSDFTEWTSGSGSWINSGRWSAGLPNPFQRTEIHGACTITIPPGNYVAGDLEIGLKAGDNANVILDGGQLLVLQDSLRVGELTGGQGEFILKDGALH